MQPKKIRLFSDAGRLYDKCRRIKPLSRTQRQRVYASCQITVESDKKPKKLEPFNTISRQSRDSYLLRVTKETNTETNYEAKFEAVLKKDKRPTIDQASFSRIIGPVNDVEYSIEPNKNRDHRCLDSFLELQKNKNPLTPCDILNWRKKHQHLDFSKQINPQRTDPLTILKDLKSTKDQTALQSFGQAMESKFNNYRRFSLVFHGEKSHDFKSDFGHKYLQQILNREIEPEYNILSNKEELIKKSMNKPKGQLRFAMYREQIKMRVDRSDPNWMQTLDYDSDTTPKTNKKSIRQSSSNKKHANIDFDLQTQRCANIVHSQYPIRQALHLQLPINH